MPRRVTGTMNARYQSLLNTKIVLEGEIISLRMSMDKAIASGSMYFQMGNAKGYANTEKRICRLNKQLIDSHSKLSNITYRLAQFQ